MGELRARVDNETRTEDVQDQERQRPRDQAVRPSPEDWRQETEARHERRPDGAWRKADQADIPPDRHERRDALIAKRQARHRRQHHQHLGDDHHVQARNRKDVYRPRVDEHLSRRLRNRPPLSEEERAIEIRRLATLAEAQPDAFRKVVPQPRGRSRLPNAGRIAQPGPLAEAALFIDRGAEIQRGPGQEHTDERPPPDGEPVPEQGDPRSGQNQGHPGFRAGRHQRRAGLPRSKRHAGRQITKCSSEHVMTSFPPFGNAIIISQNEIG